MPDDEQRFTLRQVDQARTDFAISEDNLELLRTALMGAVGGAAVVILWMEVFWRCCL